MYLTRKISNGNNTQTCNVTLGSFNFDTCGLADAGVFTVTDSLGGVLSLSLGQNDTSSYSNNTDTWGVYVDQIGRFYDVADQSPRYDLLSKIYHKI